MTHVPLKIVISAAHGRMGQALVKAIDQREDCVLTGALEHTKSKAIGLDAGYSLGIETGVIITTDAKTALKQCDIFIDFSRPDHTLSYLPLCEQLGINTVIGTTGFDHEDKNSIQMISQNIGIVFAPNFSVGVNLMLSLLQTSAQVLNDGYDVEIIEAHHRNKIDAPSGTALRMGEVIADTLNIDLQNSAVYGRQGQTGIRNPKTIGFSSIRAGDIVGDHTALFATDGERLEITHKASSRETFAHGAIRAALWLATKKTGLFDMQDVLGLK